MACLQRTETFVRCGRGWSDLYSSKSRWLRGPEHPMPAKKQAQAGTNRYFGRKVRMATQGHVSCDGREKERFLNLAPCQGWGRGCESLARLKFSQTNITMVSSGPWAAVAYTGLEFPKL